jgi:DNA adenine methylase Dam
MQMLCEEKINLEIIQSPLNYTGGKYKLLSQILPLFPKQIDIFVDLFCGGGNVGINVNSQRVIFNDIKPEVIQLLSFFNNQTKDFFLTLNTIIEKYGLSQSSQFGYDYYGCNSSIGLGAYNRDRFLRLRKEFNEMKNIDPNYYPMLYVLIVFSFNNQIRFNSKGEFNLPVGKRDFNEKMQMKLEKFTCKLKNKNCEFVNFDFRAFDISILTSNSLVYIDPPYLITCATYNEQGRWNSNDEKDLLNFLNDLNARGIKFALSNVFRSRNRENLILMDWANKNSDKYHIINLDFSYKNSNYQIKNREVSTEEVLIINY